MSENTGLGISEKNAELLLRNKEQQAATLKAEILKEDVIESQQIATPQVANPGPPPPGIKTAADLRSGSVLGKANIFHKRQIQQAERENLANELGMKVIPLDNLPSGGIFYEPGTEIAIRAGRVDEIRHFSTIDEEDIIDVDDKLNFIIEKCVRIRVPGKMVNSYKDILELDRFYLVFAVRELTFSEGENKIQMKLTCNECNNIDTVDIKRDNFHLINLDERLKKYFNEEKRCFTFKTKTGEEFDLYFATLGIAEHIKKFIKNKVSKNQKIDQAFLAMAPFLFNDWRKLTDESFNEMNYETLRWSVEKIGIMTRIVDIIKASASNEIVQYCSVCGTEVRQPITFQGGYKSLFIVSDIFELLV